jgi:predicted Zn-dependent peptidase
MLRRNTGLSSHFATKDKDKVLTIIKEVLLNPVLTLEFEKEKSRLLVGWTAKRKSTICIGAYFQFYTETMSMAI